MRTGDIEYVKVDDCYIAHRTYIGDSGGDHRIVMVNGTNFPMDSLPEDPIARRLLEGLAGLGSVTVFDRRGIGLSDPITDWDRSLREQWADDLAGVIVAAGCKQPTAFSWETSAVARTCSVQNPGLIGRLVLLNPSAPVVDADLGWIARFSRQMEAMRAGVLPDITGQASPGRAADPSFRAWVDAAGRAGASPRVAERIGQKGLADPPLDNSLVETPTLVITRSPPDFVVPSEYFRRAVGEIPGAEHVELGDGDLGAIGLGVDDLLAAISQYVTGEVRIPTPERQVAVVLFTDLVGSTLRAVAAGDAVWKQLLDRHDATSRLEVARRGGEVIKTTGDGVLALLPSASAAIDAARSIRRALAADDLSVRIGMHVGEVDRRGDDVSGLAVNITARIMATAEPGQILVSNVVRLMTEVATFADIGPRTLKGIEGEWDLHEVVSE